MKIWLIAFTRRPACVLDVFFVKKKETGSGSLLIATKRTLCSLLRHLWNCCLEMDSRVLMSMHLALSTESPLACISGVPMLPTAFTRDSSFFLLARGVEQLSQDDGSRGDQSFVQSNSLADVLFVTDGFLLESLLRSVRQSDTIEPTAIPALQC